MTRKEQKPIDETADVAKESEICGIIMPISAMPPDYTSSHWADLRKVYNLAIENTGMVPQIASDSFESDVIQRRIVHNLYSNSVVVCDVSGLNPNVMFELGMRLAFQRPVIIVTDDTSTLPFDTSVIEHLSYPRDLHIHQMNDFIGRLSDRIVSVKDQVAKGQFKSYIETFGSYEVLAPSTKSVSGIDLVLHEIAELRRTVNRYSGFGNSSGRFQVGGKSSSSSFNEMSKNLIVDIADDDLTPVIDIVKTIPGMLSVEVVSFAENKHLIRTKFRNASGAVPDLVTSLFEKSGATIVSSTDIP